MNEKNNTTALATRSTGAQLMERALIEINNLDWDQVRETYAKNATDTEFAIFCDKCKALALDPRKKEIYFVKYGSNPGQHIVGYDVYLKRANRTGLLNGWDIQVATQNGKPVSATVTIYRKDWEQPFTWTCEREEFDKNQATWKNMPGFMLKKVTIAQGFRLCFPDECGDLPYTAEEISTFADQHTAELALASTRKIQASGINMEVEPEPKAEPEQEPSEPEQEPETGPFDEGPDENPKDGEETKEETLNKEVQKQILSAFKEFDIGKKLIESVVGLSMNKMTDEHRQWLLDQYHK